MCTHFSTKNPGRSRRLYLAAGLFLLALGLVLPAAAQAKTVTADVAILDHVLVFNRLGAQNLNAMIFALERDLVDATSLEPCGDGCTPGNTMLRPDKRPRPLVLRVSAGDTLVVNFKNLLTSISNPDPPFDAVNGPANPDLAAITEPDNQVAGRKAGFHVQGLQLVGGISSDASNVGTNASSLANEAGGTATYRYLAEKEGAFLVTSLGATFGGEATGGNVGVGAFGAVMVEPRGAKYYRSQVTEEELRLATTGHTADGQPIIDYEASYPNTEPWRSEGKARLPVLNMLDRRNNLVHSDINAIIVGPNRDGSFPASTYPEYVPSYPNRLEPFREFASIWSDEMAVAQAFEGFFNKDLNPTLAHTLHGVRDSFMINYGSGGIGSEIIANRLGVGPMWDCLDCAYEEFFLTSFTVGDPAMLVDVPANTGLEGPIPATPFVGPKATRAFYPADPANVHHGYIGDFVKFRNVHAGPKEQHIFHLHNHQWLFNPNDPNSNYIDAQGIGPGSGYTYEMVNGGGGNRNKTAGDAIFHCHFYPHFAQGMWYLWRIHDVTETGTVLNVTPNTDGVPTGFHENAWDLKDGSPAHVDNGAGPIRTLTRALPDGEILVGTPIPAVVPLPGKPMAPMPAPVTLVTKDTNVDGDPESSQANVTRVDADDDGVLDNPGFPFWIAGIDCGGAAGLADPTGCRDGIVGQRPTTPPLDMLTAADATALTTTSNPVYNPLFAAHPGFNAAAGGFDGGLPRHALDGFRAVEATLGGGRADPTIVVQHQNRLDFRKEIHKAKPVYYPEQGTDLELAAMAFHAEKFHDTFRPDGTAATGTSGFRTNGAPPVPGAPYQEPCVDDQGNLFTATGQFFGGDPGSFFPASSAKNASAHRVYKGANIQIDAVFNKVGYHFPQQRIISLWGDVDRFRSGTKPPEPFVIRMNTFDCTQYYHTNLVPNEYELDDYQVRTPTDIIGQHIHLPKWDLTTADGAANGWNYEDGTLSFETVIERIDAINDFNADGTRPDVLTLPKPDGSGGGLVTLAPANYGIPLVSGARVTIQRWFADPVINREEEDRGLGIIFTHDHYGPSTHQQVGLYATVLTEPAGSTWKHNETGVPLGTDSDGGPTSWQAIITPGAAGGPGQPASNEPYREFYFEFGDFQHAYEAGTLGILDVAAPDPNTFRAAINPSFRQEANTGPGGSIFPDIVRFPPTCPDGLPRPCPEAISADDVGMLVVNYRNEPVGLRVFDPATAGPDGKNGTQAAGAPGDLAFALQSRVDREIPAMNLSPATLAFWTQTLNSSTAVGPGDPFTPMLRVYANDLVRIKIQAGATEHEHNATIHGVKWLQGGSGFGAAPNSGWRNAQNDGISEQYTFAAPLLVDTMLGDGGFANLPESADYAYSLDNSQDGWWSGMWGIMRAYTDIQTDLPTLSSNSELPLTIDPASRSNLDGVCPADEEESPRRIYDITAVLANDVLANIDGVNGEGEPAAVIVPADASATMHVGGLLDTNGGTLVYNPRSGSDPAEFQGPLHDPTAMMYVRTEDLVPVNDAAEECLIDGEVIDPATGLPATDPAQLPDCAVELDADWAKEPVVLRAAAGDCIEVTLRNRLPEVAPDLAGYNTLLQMVLRNRDDAGSVTTFNNNLIRPSSHVGLHPQMVAYDVTLNDGVVVGQNDPSTQGVVAPGESHTYRWYAGHLKVTPAAEPAAVAIDPTPVEFGGTNLSPADKVKQGQKGLVGALIVEPQGTAWTEDAGMRAAADVGQDRRGGPRGTPDGVPDRVDFRDFAVVIQKGLNLRYGTDGTAVENIAGEGGAIPEDSHDAGQKAINYGTEPAWYRFNKRASTPFGNGGGELGAVVNPERLYSNSLAGGDPATPVFTAGAGQEARMRLLEPTGVGRGTTFDLHGHIWQRDPYLDDPANDVPSRWIGDNPIGFYLGHQESITPGAHYDIVLPEAGGANGVPGDYLFRDHGSFGNTDGLWGIFRVE